MGVYSRFEIFPQSEPVYAVAFGLPLNNRSLFSCFFNWLRPGRAGDSVAKAYLVPAIRPHSGECSYIMFGSGFAGLGIEKHPGSRIF